MRLSKLSAVILTAMLATTVTAASAGPPTTTQTSQTSPPPTAIQVVRHSEAEGYAKREAKDSAASRFEGGGETIILGVSSVGVLFLVLVILIIL